jgi:hypothetical protein
MTSYTAEDHLGQLWRVLDPTEKDRIKKWVTTEKGIKKFLDHLEHNISPHLQFTSWPERGKRDPASLLLALRKLGAGDMCFLISSDDHKAVGFVLLEPTLVNERRVSRMALFYRAFPDASPCSGRHRLVAKESSTDRYNKATSGSFALSSASHRRH